MTDPDSSLVSLERSARDVARLSGATKVISLVMLGIAAAMLLYALSRVGSRTDDFIGFGLIAVAIAAFALLFWSTAAFHAAFGQSLRIAVALHRNVDELVRLYRTANAAVVVDVTAPVTSLQIGAERPGVWGAPPAPPAGGTGASPFPGLETEAEPIIDDDATAEPSGDDAAGDASATETPRPPPEEPEMKSCIHCGGSIRSDASRCRHCMERV